MLKDRYFPKKEGEIASVILSMPTRTLSLNSFLEGASSVSSQPRIQTEKPFEGPCVCLTSACYLNLTVGCDNLLPE